MLRDKIRSTVDLAFKTLVNYNAGESLFNKHTSINVYNYREENIMMVLDYAIK